VADHLYSDFATESEQLVSSFGTMRKSERNI
jgi:hypothetical protein